LASEWQAGKVRIWTVKLLSFHSHRIQTIARDFVTRERGADKFASARRVGCSGKTVVDNSQLSLRIEGL
jgi:hypothetical protein